MSPHIARKTLSPIIARAAAIVAAYATAVTLRQVHYRLVAEAFGGYRNTENDYKNLSRLSAEARRNGAFPTTTITGRTSCATSRSRQ